MLLRLTLQLAVLSLPLHTTAPRAPAGAPAGAPAVAPAMPGAPPAAIAPKTVAVLDFDNNSGRTEYERIGSALAAMTISDLSSVPALQLVERQRINDVITEQKLQRTNLFDSTTAVRAGKLVGAQYILTGSFAAVQPSVRIDTRVISVETGQIVKTAHVTGKEDKFFELQQKLDKELIDGLDVALSPEDRALLEQRQEANRMRELETVALYAGALAAFDAGDYVTTVERLQPVLQREPASAVVQRTYDEAKSRASNKAKETAKDKVRNKLRGLFGRP
jgi:TolB-like protein